jgi:hypothetical protein
MSGSISGNAVAAAAAAATAAAFGAALSAFDDKCQHVAKHALQFCSKSTLFLQKRAV